MTPAPRSLLASRIHSTFNRFVERYRPASLLDIGTHRGDVISGCLFASWVPPRMVGVDFVPDPLVPARAMARGIQRERGLTSDVRYVVADVRSLPFPDQSFEVVTSHGCLIHMAPDEIEGVLRGIFRVAKLACLVESENRWMPVQPKPSNTRFQRYWRIRSRYYSFKMMSPRLYTLMGKMPYYWAHPYRALFKTIGATLVRATCLSPKSYTWAYVVKGGPRG